MLVLQQLFIYQCPVPFHWFETKLTNLQLKTQPKQVLGYLPLEFMPPELNCIQVFCSPLALFYRQQTHFMPEVRLLNQIMDKLANRTKPGPSFQL